jgi:thiamine-monophosphate kinase
MKISDLGEFGFIDRVASSFQGLLKEGFTGIGDDCAVLPKNESQVLVVTTDMLAEDVHFYRSKISARELGFKSLAVNLSDIAAMGGKPESSFLSLGVPADTDISWLDGFFDGYRELSLKENVMLCGGDTISSDRIVINVTIIGSAEKSLLRMRSMAAPGEIICCTDNLGDSAAGFRILQQDLAGGEDENFLVRRHHCPVPGVAEGQWLARRRGVRAMIDISDGISSDLRHILRASSVGASLDLERIPLSRQLRSVSERHQWDPLDLAVNGGEDYCLLLTVDSGEFENISAAFEETFRRPLTAIGGTDDMAGDLRLFLNGKQVRCNGSGFHHF